MPATQGIVVHRGQVVVHERVGMHQLNGRAGRESGRIGAAEGFTGGAGEGRAQSLAA